MTRQQSSLRTPKCPVIVGCVGLLVALPVGCASAQELVPDLRNAMENLVVDMAARDGHLQPVPPAQPGDPGGKPSAYEPDLVLLGVVIAGEARMALLQDTRANPGGARLLPVGASVAGHRLTDVQADRVTLEGRGGARLIVRLGPSRSVGAGGPGRTPASATLANPRASLAPGGDGGSKLDEADSVQAKEDRQGREAERIPPEARPGPQE